MFAIKGSAKKISRKFMHELDLISISGNKGEAEIDLQQIQDGVVLKLQERLSFCWQCKWLVQARNNPYPAMYSEKRN